MENERLVEALEKSNKWWKEKFEIEFKHREIYTEIRKFLHTKQIISLTGLRRTGKTTIMFKIVSDFVKKYGSRNVLYFSFDDFREEKLISIINLYARVLNKDISKEDYLILFDEIQKVENWEEQLKRIYDNHPNIKFIISGSESLFIRKKTRESLAGRMFEFHVKTLSFKEYLLFKNKKFDNPALYKEEILREFNQFLLSSGFPEIINENEEIIAKYIKDNVIDKIIYKDMAQILSIKEPAIIEQVFKIVLSDPGEIINIENLSKETGISRQTISLYLDYLEKSFLIKKLYTYSKSPRKTQRRVKKYYPVLFLPELVKKTEMFGKLFENFAVLELDAEFFWRDSYKNEVDIIKIKENKVLPIEVKSGKIEYNSLKLFMKKFKVPKGIILTYQIKDKINFDSGEIEILPFYEYLL